MQEMGNYNSIFPFQFPALKMTAKSQFMPNWNVLPTNQRLSGIKHKPIVQENTTVFIGHLVEPI